MIVQYSNVIVNRKKRLSRLAFMHGLASSLCFWVSSIFRETMDSIVKEALDNRDYEINRTYPYSTNVEGKMESVY